MRHLKAGRKFGRTTAHRKAMFRNMVTALLERERIRTTLPKAKELRSKVEKTITLGKKGTLHARRRALRLIAHRDILGKLFGPLAERYAERPGGYTRIIKIGNRKGDDAPMAFIELVDRDTDPKAAASKVEKKAEKKPAAKKAKADDTKEKSEKKTEKKAAEKKPKAVKKAVKKKDEEKKEEK
ncbi:MAG: 50S ribosomal protein L17 [Candidatus Nitrohelix vancouverensis]|uniref:Large ribosomal subunit protein bL17 n=1 Tax=Candidatus Nitrohelix vancouverensis TaxID=2705534 RepID=A0A7T0C0D0_9BACT|nr:MAG: 50S ribosomal protein L17 [Candidatus Nitrohelix vancouverensis]